MSSGATPYGSKQIFSGETAGHLQIVQVPPGEGKIWELHSILLRYKTITDAAPNTRRLGVKLFIGENNNNTINLVGYAISPIEFSLDAAITRTMLFSLNCDTDTAFFIPDSGTSRFATTRMSYFKLLPGTRIQMGNQNGDTYAGDTMSYVIKYDEIG